MERTCFVGNLPLNFTKKQLKALFKEFGTIEKIWLRSIPLADNPKVPMKAKIIKKDFGDQKDNMNAYVQFKSIDEAKLAAEKLNQKEVEGGKHIRVDVCKAEGGDQTKPSSQNDYESTIFIGNLPFQVNEEELRRHFADIGGRMLTGGAGSDGILNVRIVRDKETYLSKGIAYIQFVSKPLMRIAIQDKNNSEFKGRQLRIKKAVAPERLEKKQRKKEEAFQLKKMQKRTQEEDSEFTDSEDEDGEKKALKKEKDLGINKKSKKIKKSDNDDFMEHIKKIQAKAERAAHAA